MVNLFGPADTAALSRYLDVLTDTDILLSGWGMVPMDAGFLRKVPRLRAVFYAAGSVRRIVSDDFWKHGIIMTHAAAANARPVAEYSVAAILLSLKHFWRISTALRSGGSWRDTDPHAAPGAYGSVVGLISFGLIARRVLELLRPYDILVQVHDPHVDPAAIRKTGAAPCTLPELFATSDVVSLHAPLLPSTRGMITGSLLRSMKQGATFINTARGAIVREQELIAACRARPDLTAILDVTDPEPPRGDSLLFQFPNIMVTSHIAGSIRGEHKRMGREMLDELRRYLTGCPLAYQVTRDRMRWMA